MSSFYKFYKLKKDHSKSPKTYQAYFHHLPNKRGYVIYWATKGDDWTAFDKNNARKFTGAQFDIFVHDYVEVEHE